MMEKEHEALEAKIAQLLAKYKYDEGNPKLLAFKAAKLVATHAIEDLEAAYKNQPDENLRALIEQHLLQQLKLQRDILSPSTAKLTQADAANAAGEIRDKTLVKWAAAKHEPLHPKLLKYDVPGAQESPERELQSDRPPRHAKQKPAVTPKPEKRTEGGAATPRGALFPVPTAPAPASSPSSPGNFDVVVDTSDESSPEGPTPRQLRNAPRATSSRAASGAPPKPPQQSAPSIADSAVSDALRDSPNAGDPGKSAGALADVGDWSLTTPTSGKHVGDEPGLEDVRKALESYGVGGYHDMFVEAGLKTFLQFVDVPTSSILPGKIFTKLESDSFLAARRYLAFKHNMRAPEEAFSKVEPELHSKLDTLSSQLTEFDKTLQQLERRVNRVDGKVGSTFEAALDSSFSEHARLQLLALHGYHGDKLMEVSEKEDVYVSRPVARTFKNIDKTLKLTDAFTPAGRRKDLGKTVALSKLVFQSDQLTYFPWLAGLNDNETLPGCQFDLLSYCLDRTLSKNKFIESPSRREPRAGKVNSVVIAEATTGWMPSSTEVHEFDFDRGIGRIKACVRDVDAHRIKSGEKEAIPATARQMVPYVNLLRKLLQLNLRAYMAEKKHGRDAVAAAFLIDPAFREYTDASLDKLFAKFGASLTYLTDLRAKNRLFLWDGRSSVATK